MLLAPSTALMSVLMTLPSFINAISIDCSQIQVLGVGFDISALSGPYSVVELQRTPLGYKNTTFTIDICRALVQDKDKPRAEVCPNGARVCAVERFYRKDTKSEPSPDDLWPIAGEFIHDGRELDPTYTRLKDSDSHADADKEGFRIEMNGGLHEGVKQKALVEFICQRNMTGLEGLQPATRDRRRKDEGAPPDDGGDREEPLPDPNAGQALKFRSYKVENSGKSGELGVLRLDWTTKYACEDQKDKDDKDGKGDQDNTGRNDSSSGWGFFTWFIIILFLAVAAYLIFGSWLNYSRYGARGWDLLPHGDTIRDLPYLLRDWVRRVVSTVKGERGGGGGRGYSAV